MKGKAHLAIGLLTTGIAFNTHLLPFSIQGIVGAVAGSIFLDIDHPKSIINKYILGKNRTPFMKFFTYFSISCICFLTSFFLKAGSFPLLKNILLITGVLSFMISFSSHRGFTHSYIFCISLFALTYFLSQEFSICFLIGSLLHLKCDRIYRDGKFLRAIEFLVIIILTILFLFTMSYEKGIFCLLS